MFSNSISRKNVLFSSQHVRMHRICFEPSHVNEMKRNDRTNVKSIRYITRSYTNWNENISKQDTQRGTKTKSSFQTDSDSRQCYVWLEMSGSLSLSFSVSPFRVHFRSVYRCEESLPMLSRSLCVGNILCAYRFLSVSPLIVIEIIDMLWPALTCTFRRFIRLSYKRWEHIVARCVCGIESTKTEREKQSKSNVLDA